MKEDKQFTQMNNIFIGVDPARLGGDVTVKTVWCGNKIIEIKYNEILQEVD